MTIKRINTMAIGIGMSLLWICALMLLQMFSSFQAKELSVVEAIEGISVIIFGIAIITYLIKVLPERSNKNPQFALRIFAIGIVFLALIALLATVLLVASVMEGFETLPSNVLRDSLLLAAMPAGSSVILLVSLVKATAIR